MARIRLEDGLYDELVSSPLAKQIEAARTQESALVEAEELDAADAHEIIGRHVGRWLAAALAEVPEKDRPSAQIEIANRVLAVVTDVLADRLPRETIEAPLEPRRLLAVVRASGLVTPTAPRSPATPLATSDLLTNTKNERGVGHELAIEMESADSVDLVCAFLKTSGFARMRDAFRRHLVERKRRLRVLTTTYLGGTDREVLDALHEMGAQVKVSYDTSATRLHAKAWLFERRTGFSTAYIGSSNMSVAALSDGLEWNVRVSAIESPAVLEKFRKTFDTYWADRYFEDYDPARDGERFSEALRLARGERRRDESLDSDLAVRVDILAHNYQREILEKLDAERRQHGRTRNLVVAATGTGKTVIAALDYRRIREELGNPSLLFVAHRAEILKQSQAIFRAVLRDTTFGERLFEGERPVSDRHLFASIQSLDKRDLSTIPKDHYDVVIVDEFHHAAAKIYRTLLSHFEPRYLVGLTATPERADGADVLSWFGGRIAAELRLWDAIEHGHLVPFQYFGVADESASGDLRRVSWRRGKYDETELSNLYTADHARVRLVANALRERVLDVRRMRALGFCVSVAHARFMAAEFTKLGIPSLAVSGEDDSDTRRAAIDRLVRRELNVLFSVDVLGEGVDIPDVDTVLFLRPTESATVFLQQLGRGLRRADHKGALTVLDFIGEPHERFRFDLRYRALTNAPSGKLARQVEEGFPLLPSGCSIQLDRTSQERVLRNIRRAVTTATRHLVDDLKQAGADLSLGQFLDRAGIGLEQVYRGRGKARHWRDLRILAGLPVAPLAPGDEELLDVVDTLTAFDDPECLRLWISALQQERPPSRFDPDERTRRRWQMLAVTFDNDAPAELAAFLVRLWSPAVREELVALFEVLEDRVAVRPEPLALPGSPPVPLLVRCRYSLVQILAAFDDVKETGRVVQPQQGVYLEKKTRSDLLFVTLEKSEREYSPTTMYRDYAISETLFHWESQSFAVPTSSPGIRHVDPNGQGVTPVLFVRETKKDARGLTVPYEVLGPADVDRWQGERPIQVVWKLRVPMAAAALSEARVVA